MLVMSDWRLADLMGPTPYSGETLEKQEQNDLPPMNFPPEDDGKWVFQHGKWFWYRTAGEDVQIAEKPMLDAHPILVHEGTAYVPEHHPGLVEWADDFGYKLAEVPGGGNMLDHMRHREDMELFNRGDPNWEPEPVNADLEPEGPFACPHCDFKPETFGEFKTHMDEHQPKEEEIEDGHFPQIDDFDAPLPLRRLQPFPTQQVTADRKVWARTLPSHHEARVVPEFDLYAELFGYNRDDGHHFYGAYLGDDFTGYGVVRDHGNQTPEIVMVQSSVPGKGVGTAILTLMQEHYANLYTHADSPAGERLMRRCGMVNVKGQLWKWSKGTEPKDMLESEVPFVYDIPKDTLTLGYPGSSTHDVGKGFSPGGIVEGYYAPGGKITIQTASTHPFSFRHLLDLWYWNAPQMEITSLEELRPDGSTTKLAGDDGQHVGQYIKTLVQTDVPAAKASAALHQAGGEVYVVGGAVRDALQNQTPKDVDLMVRGLPSEMVEHTLAQLPGSVKLTGKNFGVYRYRVGDQEVEVALPRTDEYQTSRRGEGKITVDPDLPVEKDLERRDFTANSMAVNLNDGRLIDPYGGAKDIERGVLRTTHPDSFKEDPTRLVRALTAHGRFGLTPDERTRHEMESNAYLLQGESPDALNKVMDKMMGSDNPAGAVRLGQETGVLQHLLPEVADNWDYDQRNPHHNYPLGEHLLHTLDNVSRLTDDPDVRMAALMHDVGKPASAWQDPKTGFNHFYQNSVTKEGQYHESVGGNMVEDRMRALNYPVARINRVKDIVKKHMFAPFNDARGARKFLQRTGDNADALLNLREADQTGKGQTPEEVAARTSAGEMRGLVEQAREQQAPVAQSALAINGNDLISMGMQPGPAIGQVLRQLTDAVVENPALNQRDQLLQLAQQQEGQT